MYAFNGDQFEVQGELVNWTDVNAAWSSFGQSVSLDRNGTTAIVGAPGYSPSGTNSNEGGTFIYRYINGVWQKEYYQEGRYADVDEPVLFA